MHTFSDSLKRLSAASIVARLGCPLSVAQQWRSGRRKPPAWQQRHWLALLAVDDAKPSAPKAYGGPPPALKERRRREVEAMEQLAKPRPVPTITNNDAALLARLQSPQFRGKGRL